MPVAYTNLLILGVFAVLGAAAAFLIADAACLFGRLPRLCSGALTRLRGRISALTGKNAPAAQAVKAKEASDADSSAAGAEAGVPAPTDGSGAKPGIADAARQLPRLSSRPADDGEEPKAALICLGSIGFFILTAVFMLSLPLILSFWNEAVNKGEQLNIGNISIATAVFAALSCSAPLFFGKRPIAKEKQTAPCA